MTLLEVCTFLGEEQSFLRVPKVSVDIDQSAKAQSFNNAQI